MLDASVQKQVALFGQGGRAVLEAIRRQDYDTLTRRPVISNWQKGNSSAAALAHFAGVEIRAEVGVMAGFEPQHRFAFCGTHRPTGKSAR